MVTKAVPIAARRDSEDTRTRILDALARIIIRDGLDAIGINSLSREARCDKVLIYRYFGDLDGVYREYAERSDIWHTTEEILAGVDPERLSLSGAVKTCIRNHAVQLRRRPLTLVVLLAAEVSQRTPLTAALEAARERRAKAVFAWLAEHYELPSGFDLQAIGLILSAAINYLASRARNIRVMSGVPIKTEADWERLLSAVDHIVDAVFFRPESSVNRPEE